MPFDGIVVKCIVEELNRTLLGGRVDKIYQPAADKIIIGVYSKGCNYKLLASANPSCPCMHITDWIGRNPSAPPMFCMLLRKHLSGGRITDFIFNDYERIIDIRVDTINEFGDRVVKRLVVEAMGRHSNIILVDDKERIIDSIKHVDEEMSSVREVMPARPYVRPPSQDKESPESIDIHVIKSGLKNSRKSLQNYLLGKIRGFSPFICTEVCKKAGIDESTPAGNLNNDDTERLGCELESLIKEIKNSSFNPWVSFGGNGNPLDFHCLKPAVEKSAVYYPEMSKALDVFYQSRDMANRITQARNFLIKRVRTSLDRCLKKKAIHESSIGKASEGDKYRLYGELITANIHSIPPDAGKVSLWNYYGGEDDVIEIPLDKNLSPQENAQMYYKKYASIKRTLSHAKKQLKLVTKEVEYLENVVLHLEDCRTPQELSEIREELVEQGIIRNRSKGKVKPDLPSQPHRYKSSDGFDIYVGRNNRQNDILTFKQSSSGDTWFHTRNIPGSHVIVRNGGRKLIDKTIEEAAILAATHSKSRTSSKVPVDYTMVKYVKKPKGFRPGMVIYNNFKTAIVDPDESFCKTLEVTEKQ